MDQKLTCVDCGNPFIWTAGEQEFYKKYGFDTPKRCKECRRKKKLERSKNDNF